MPPSIHSFITTAVYQNSWWSTKTRECQTVQECKNGGIIAKDASHPSLVTIIMQMCEKAEREEEGGPMPLTGDTCGGRRTGSPSRLHFQSETPPAARDKHQEPVPVSPPWASHTNLMATQLQQNRFEEALWPITDITHVVPLPSEPARHSVSFSLETELRRVNYQTPSLTVNPLRSGGCAAQAGQHREGVSSYISWHRRRWTFTPGIHTQTHTTKDALKHRLAWCM